MSGGASRARGFQSPGGTPLGLSALGEALCPRPDEGGLGRKAERRTTLGGTALPTDACVNFGCFFSRYSVTQ